MKKLIVFVLLLACLLPTVMIKNERNPLFSLGNVEKVCFVSNEKFEGFESVNCGDLVFNFCSLESVKNNINELCRKSEGLEFYFQEVDMQNVLAKLKAILISETEVESVHIVVAYTPYYQDCIFVDGKKANVQLAGKDGKLIVGFPAILTGF